jgi:hypothetical protein
MFKKIAKGCFLVLPVLLTVTTANAHHSFAATFKADAVISVEGVVTEFRFKNPHVLVYLDVTNEDGSVTQWVSEGSSATGKRRDGWDRNTIQAGQKIRITGDSTHDGSPMVSMEAVEFLDANSGAVVKTLGEEADADSAEPLVALPLKLKDGRPNLSGAWDRIRGGSRGGSPESLDGVPPFNAAGEAAQAAYNRADDPQIFCEPPGVVRQAGFTPHVVRITQNDDHVVLEYEEYGGRRVVYFGDELPAAGVKSHLGDSVARYEGDTLVIETRNLLSNPSHPWGYQTSDQVSTVEIYKRADDPQIGSILHATMIVTDPGYLNEPWELIRERSYRDGYEFIENDCRPPLRERTVTKN